VQANLAELLDEGAALQLEDGVALSLELGPDLGDAEAIS
jgi:hypothetical protein